MTINTNVHKCMMGFLKIYFNFYDWVMIVIKKYDSDTNTKVLIS